MDRPFVSQADIDCVHRHFKALCLYFNASAQDPRVQREWRDLQDAYGEKHRHYHNFGHIAYLLREGEKMGLSERDLNEFRAFAIYHDFDYATENMALYRQNEFLSAARGTRFLAALQAPNDFVDIFKSRVIATNTHHIDPDADPLGAAAFDLDMSILGAPRDVYAKYAGDIRKEFYAAPDEMFYPRRLQFLETTLDQSVYKTPGAQKLLNARTRANMEWEIDRIRERLKLTA